MVGWRLVEYIKAAIRINLIIDNPVTNKSVQWATNIYGPYIGRLKAHTTRRRPNPVVDKSIDILDELIEVQKYVTIVMDGLKINGLKFFLQYPCIFISVQCIIWPIKQRYIINEHWTISTVSIKEADLIRPILDVIMNFKQRWIQ